MIKSGNNQATSVSRHTPMLKLITMVGCQPCAEVKFIINQHDMPVEVVDATPNKQYYKERYGLTTVPTLVYPDGSTLSDSVKIIKVLKSMYK